MPVMPREATRESTSALPVDTPTLLYTDSIRPVNITFPGEPAVTFPPISARISPWKITAKAAASRVERASTIMAGRRLAIIIPVTRGTIRSQGVMLNLACSTPV